MDSPASRVAFGLLLLLGSSVAGWGEAPQPPSREVVELVSVVYKPARPEALAAAQPQPEPPLVELVPAQSPAAPQLVKASVATPVIAKASVATPAVVKASCRPPRCRSAAPVAKANVRRAGVQQARISEPPVPAAFLPIRKLGLYLQARLGSAQDTKSVPRKSKGR